MRKKYINLCKNKIIRNKITFGILKSSEQTGFVSIAGMVYTEKTLLWRFFILHSSFLLLAYFLNFRYRVYFVPSVKTKNTFTHVLHKFACNCYVLAYFGHFYIIQVALADISNSGSAVGRMLANNFAHQAAVPFHQVI